MTVKTHDGKVLGTNATLLIDSTYLGDGDSAYYALIWDTAANAPVPVGLSWDYDKAREAVVLDATPEIKAAYAAHLKAIEDRKAADKAAAEARKVAKGKRVRVVNRDKGAAVGTEGVVIWYGEGKSFRGYGRGPMRAGVKDAAGTVYWVNAASVEVVLDAAAVAA